MSRQLQVGVQLPEVEYESRWSNQLELAKLIEAAGFDSIWVGDHLLYSDDRGVIGPWEAWTQLAALAVATDRVLLGPLVASTSFHAPAMLAKMASTVDEISGGRLILGLGAGWNRTEYDAFGFPYDYRVSRFEEAFEIIRRLVAGETVTFSGEYYSVTHSVLQPPSAKPGGPPIMLGSQGERMLSIAAPYMHWWNSWYAWHANDPDALAPIHAKVDEALRTAGRDPSSVVKTAAALVQFEEGTGRQTAYMRRVPLTPITGSAGQMAAELRRWHAVGVEHLQLVLDPITAPSIEKAAAVLTALRS